MLRCLVLVPLLACFAPAADDAKPAPWSGLLFKDAVAALAGKVEKKLGPGPFACGVIADAAAYDKFLAALAKAPRKAEPHWADWKKTIDWKKEAVAYVVLTHQTNRLTYQSCEPCKGGATLAVKWSGIEPFYADSYPAVFTRVPRDGIQTMKFRVDDMELAEVPLPK